jgi:hypothetical protein
MKKNAQISLKIQTPGVKEAASLRITVFQLKKFLQYNGGKGKIWNNMTYPLQAASNNEGKDIIAVPVTVTYYLFRKNK